MVARPCDRRTEDTGFNGVFPVSGLVMFAKSRGMIEDRWSLTEEE